MFALRPLIPRLIALSFTLVAGEAIAETTRRTAGQEALAQAAGQQKFALVLFYRTADRLTESIAKTLGESVAKRGDQAVDIHVQITNPAEKALVDSFRIGRAPMPLVIAVAPNGAITGIFQQKFEERFLDEAIVTPGMAHCMKKMQEGKLVLLCVDSTRTATVPAAVGDFKTDPQFKDRLAVVSLISDDANETRFFKSLEIDPANFRGSTMVLMAPPGTIVGKYAATATKDKLAADLHAAGKCCDDPNCKHAKQGK
jgi:hypothetical protein